MITQRHFYDADGNPEGGQTFGPGFAIAWQRGPLGRGVERQPQNGAFVEEVLQAVIGRLEFFQNSQFASAFNADALEHLQAALQHLNNRTRDRVSRGVEGTHSH